MSRNGIAVLKAAVIAAAVAWIYAPAIRGGWVWDDRAEVADNSVLRDPKGWLHAWTTPVGPDYFPLKTDLQWIEWRLWGGEPVGYHWVSAGLHAVGAILFWAVLRRLGLGSFGAWFGGLLFAVHPLAVESVAWTAEFKNVLSTALMLGSGLAFLAWEERVSSAAAPWRAGPRSDKAALPYALSLVLFLLAMLAKSTVAMLPCVLGLILWRQSAVTGKGPIYRSKLAGLAPFFAIAAGLGLVTVWFQSSRAIHGVDLGVGGFGTRIAGAGLALAFYAGKVLAPVGLMPFYPAWKLAPIELWRLWPWPALGVISAWLWRRRRGRWSRGALLGVGSFVLLLLPVLGLVPMAYLRIAWVADHFVYAPMLGLLGLVAWIADRLARRTEGGGGGVRVAAGAAGAALVAVLAVASRSHAAIYRSDERFWTYALERNPGAWIAENNLGELLDETGRTAAALGHLEAAVRLQPGYPEARNNLGTALVRSGRLPEAIDQFVAALRLEPDYAAARSNLGDALVQTGRLDEAMEQYRQVIQLNAAMPSAHAGLAYVLGATGRLPEALDEYQAALALDPDNAATRKGYGVALARSGRLAEAIGQFRRAVALEPGNAEAHFDLGQALRLTGRTDEATEEFIEAERLRGGRR